MNSDDPTLLRSDPPSPGGALETNAQRCVQSGPDPAAPKGWAPPPPEELARLLPQYQIEGLLGRGGMGAVYKGRQVSLDRAVAIKLLPSEMAADPQFVLRFQREARTLARLQHPGIVAVYDFGQTVVGHLYFVMEFVDGADLDRAIRSAGVKPPEVLKIISQICDALQYSHSQGVIHRDIKPANVLVTSDGRTKLADFGLARPIHEDTALTSSNVIMGTADYMAPEQRFGRVDHRADLYALGVMLYEMLTGQTPRGAFRPPSERVRVDVRVDQVVQRALQQEPERRYQNANEMKTEVDRIRSSPVRPIAKVSDSSRRKEAKKANSPILPLLVAAVTLVAILAPCVLFYLDNVRKPAIYRNRINKLATGNPHGAARDVPMLIRFLSEDPKWSDARVLGILSTIQGLGVDDAIVNELTKAEPGPIRTGLLRVVANRGTSTAFEPVLKIYRSTEAGQERGIAVEALLQLATPGKENVLLGFLKDNIPNRPELENAVVTLIRMNPNVTTRTDVLLKELEQSSGDHRRSLNRILGRIGGIAALQRLTRMAKVKASDEAYLADILLGLSRWPDRTAGPLLRELMASNFSSISADSARAYIRLLSMPAEESAGDGENWKFVLEKALRGDALNVFECIADTPTASTLNFLTSHQIPGWQRTFEQARRIVEEAAAAAIPVQSGKLIAAKLAKPRGELGDSAYVEDGSYWPWTTPSTWFLWVLNFSKPGTYKLEVLASAENGGGSDFVATLAGQKLSCQSVGTASKTAFAPAKINGSGTFEIKPDQVGVQVLGLQGAAVTKPKIMNVKGIRLTWIP